MLSAIILTKTIWSLKNFRAGRMLLTGLFLALIGICYLYGLHNKILEVKLSRKSFTYPLDVEFSSHFDHDGRLVIDSEWSIVNPYEIDFVRSPEDQEFCPGDLLALVIVKSSLGNFEHRSTLRQSLFSRLKIHGMRGLFILGSDDQYEAGLRESIAREWHENRDLIQYNFMDSYFNNTYKAIAAFQWQHSHCIQSKYLVMMDDDFYVNVPNLQKLLLQRTGNADDYADFITGYVFAASYPHRYKWSKWEVSLAEYQWSTWPPYPTAGFYIVSKPLSDRLNQIFPFVKYLRFDDAYLGIALWRLNVTPIGDWNRFLYFPPVFFYRLKEIIAVHCFGKYELVRKMFNLVHEEDKTADLL